jgi:glutathione S-transferase
MSPYGSFEVVLETVIAELTTKPYLLGDEISAADILWASALRWGSLFGLVPPNAIIAEYIARVGERPAVKKVADVDAALAAGVEAAPGERPPSA